MKFTRKERHQHCWHFLGTDGSGGNVKLFQCCECGMEGVY